MACALDRFRGIFPAAFTMLDADCALNNDATARHWDWLIRQGVDRPVIVGQRGSVCGSL